MLGLIHAELFKPLFSETLVLMLAAMPKIFVTNLQE
jgi:hypothetical protein